MKAGKFQSSWIMLRTLWTTLQYSVRAIWVGCFHKNARLRLDEMLRGWCQCLLRYAQVSYQIFNPRQIKFIPGRFYIIMSNHCSHYDIPLIYMAFPGSIRMMAKKELFRVPIWGRAMKVNEFISIDRHNHEQAVKDLEFAKQKMKSGIILWVAPEGTRSRTGKIGSFKKGGFMVALQLQATIIPVGIRGSYSILPPGTWKFHLGQHAEVHIGKPIEAINYSLATRHQLMLDVEKSIRQLVDPKDKVTPHPKKKP